MCGIVGVFGDTDYMAVRKMFNIMLYLDVVRGEDSTGVFTVTPDNKVKYAKYAETPEKFLSRKKIDEHLSFRNSYNAIIGHNRAATVGAVDDASAHPFSHKHITMVHNGTLRNEHLLESYKKHTVDSEMLCDDISSRGFRETLKGVDGAFTLVWYDDKEKRLRFVRNTERPLWIARIKVGAGVFSSTTTFAIASEKWMIEVAAKKAKVQLASDITKVEDHEVWDIDIEALANANSNTFKDTIERSKLEVDVKQTKWWDSWYGQDYVYSSPKKQTAKLVGDSSNKKGDKEGQRRDLSVQASSAIKMDTFTPKSGVLRGNKYFLKGVNQMNVDVRCLVTVDEYMDWVNGDIETITAKVIATNHTGKHTKDKEDFIFLSTLAGGAVIEKKQETSGNAYTDDDVPFDLDDTQLFLDETGYETLYVGFRGKTLTEKEFLEATKDGCANCTVQAELLNDDEINWLDESSFLCDHCHEEEQRLMAQYNVGYKQC